MPSEASPAQLQPLEEASSQPLLQMLGIRKSFAGVEVLHGVDFSVEGGEVVALMGENGAGKSTLMKILGGDYARDGGDILLEGAPVQFRSPSQAEAAGVRIIYQELNYAPELSVMENVLLGHLPRRPSPLGFVVDWPEAHRRASQVLGLLKADIDPREKVGALSVGKQQLVEIAKALSHPQTRILVMDEPTAALTSREVQLLFETIQSLQERGVAIIYISHRLDEVEQVAQRVTILRDGVVAGDAPMRQLSRHDIVKMMVGREVESLYPPRKGTPGEVVLQVAALSHAGFENVSFEVRAGEIVGLYGLLGAGQMEVVRALFGSPPAASGTITLGGRAVSITSPGQAKRQGLGFVSEDRKVEGLVLGMSVAENLTLGNWSSVSSHGVFAASREAERASHWTQVLGIRARGGAAQAVGTLSGGNQQKVVLARWLEAGARVLLLAEPTRGVDVGARADIYGVLEELREQGLALILVSTDMEEVLALSDRVLVFVRGRITAQFDRASANQEALLAAAASALTR